MNKYMIIANGCKASIRKLIYILNDKHKNVEKIDINKFENLMAEYDDEEHVFYTIKGHYRNDLEQDILNTGSKYYNLLSTTKVLKLELTITAEQHEEYTDFYSIIEGEIKSKMREILIKDTLVNINEVYLEDIDISLIIRDLIYCGYLDDDELLELTSKREHTIEYGIATSEYGDIWVDGVGTNLDYALHDLKNVIDDTLRKKKYKKDSIMMPYLTILFDGYDLVSFGISNMNTEYNK